MKIFEHNHAKGKYWQHAKKAGFISGLFIGSGVVGIAHAVCPWFLPEFLTEANKRISKELDQKLCECPADD